MIESTVRCLGALLQGVVIGALAFFSLLVLRAESAGDIIFRYQGF